MLKKSITYEDFYGKEVTEDHYFHLSKADLIEMEVSHKGGMQEHLQRIIDSEDGAAIIAELRRLILSAYGERSEDGRRFIKTQELRDEFQSTEAYSTLFMELCLDSEKAAEFVNGIVPPSLERDVAKLRPETNSSHPSDPAAKPMPKVLTEEEVQAMDSDELKSGLATGRYKLST